MCKRYGRRSFRTSPAQKGLATKVHASRNGRRKGGESFAALRPPLRLCLNFVGLKISDPAIDLVHRGFENLIRRESKLLRRLERMIAAFDRVDLRSGAEVLNVRLNL